MTTPTQHRATHSNRSLVHVAAAIGVLVVMCLPGISAQTGVKLIDDPDGDGQPSTSEVGHGSDPIQSASTFYSDDDGDGTQNYYEPKTDGYGSIVCTGSLGLVYESSCKGYQNPPGSSWPEPAWRDSAGRIWIWDSVCVPAMSGNYAPCKATSNYVLTATPYNGNYLDDGYGWRLADRDSAAIATYGLCPTATEDADGDGIPTIHVCTTTVTIGADGTISQGVPQPWMDVNPTVLPTQGVAPTRGQLLQQADLIAGSVGKIGPSHVLAEGVAQSLAARLDAYVGMYDAGALQIESASSDAARAGNFEKGNLPTRIFQSSPVVNAGASGSGLTGSPTVPTPTPSNPPPPHPKVPSPGLPGPGYPGTIPNLGPVIAGVSEDAKVVEDDVQSLEYWATHTVASSKTSPAENVTAPSADAAVKSLDAARQALASIQSRTNETRPNLGWVQPLMASMTVLNSMGAPTQQAENDL